MIARVFTTGKAAVAVKAPGKSRCRWPLLGSTLEACCPRLEANRSHFYRPPPLHRLPSPVKQGCGLRGTHVLLGPPGSRVLGVGFKQKEDPRREPEAFTHRLAPGSYSLTLFSESGSHRQPLAACLRAGSLVVSTVSVALTPLESLCFEQVSFWVGVVARNNGKSGRVVDGTPYTRLPASELVSNLEERFPFLSVTVRQVRKALNRLVELGLVVREQFWQRHWRSDYWYSLPVAEAVTPQPPTSEPRSDQNGHPLSALSTSSTHPEQTRRTDVDEQTQNQQPQTPASRVNGEGTSAPPEPPTRGRIPQDRPVPPVANSNPLAGLQGSVRDRINALAALFDPRTVQPVSPSAVVLGNRTHRINDGACAPLR